MEATQLSHPEFSPKTEVRDILYHEASPKQSQCPTVRGFSTKKSLPFDRQLDLAPMLVS